MRATMRARSAGLVLRLRFAVYSQVKYWSLATMTSQAAFLARVTFRSRLSSQAVVRTVSPRSVSLSVIARTGLWVSVVTNPAASGAAARLSGAVWVVVLPGLGAAMLSSVVGVFV